MDVKTEVLRNCFLRMKSWTFYQKEQKVLVYERSLWIVRALRRKIRFKFREFEYKAVSYSEQVG